MHFDIFGPPQSLSVLLCWFQQSRLSPVGKHSGPAFSVDDTSIRPPDITILPIPHAASLHDSTDHRVVQTTVVRRDKLRREDLPMSADMRQIHHKLSLK